MSDFDLVVEWRFEPADYFEACEELTRPEYEMRIEPGKATARVKAEYYPNKSEDEIADILDTGLKCRFLGAQVQSHRPFTLSEPSLLRVYPDGREVHIWKALGTIEMEGEFCFEYTCKDKDGNVVYDSKQARIEEKETFVNLAEKHPPRNPFVRRGSEGR